MKEYSYDVCRTCHEKINKGAKKCIKCDSFQDWRRYVGVSTTSLSLFVALLSVLSLFITVIDDVWVEDENITISVIDENSGFLKFAISNSGEKSAVISPSVLFLTPGKKELFSGRILSDTTKPTIDLVIEPGAIKIFSAKFGQIKGFSVEQFNKEKKCVISIEVVNIDGEKEWKNDEYKCGFEKI